MDKILKEVIMRYFFKNFALFSLCLICATALVGCENSTALRTATFSDISVSGSDNYGIGVRFQTDKRLEGKYVDIQVKSDKAMQNISIWQDNAANKYSFNILANDEWQSITTILVNAQEKPNTEKFEKYDKVTARRYLFSSPKPITLIFRVVAGDIVENVQGTGDVIVETEPISNEFKLKVEGKNDDNSDS